LETMSPLSADQGLGIFQSLPANGWQTEQSQLIY
jgi:hypothetical protein